MFRILTNSSRSLFNRRINPKGPAIHTQRAISNVTYYTEGASSFSYSLHYVNSIFNSLKKKGHEDVEEMNQALKLVILTNHYQEALEHSKPKNDLIANIPQSWPYSKKISYLKEARIKHYSAAVITGHPTEILKEMIRRKMNRVVNNMLELDQCRRGSEKSTILEKQILEDVTTLAKESMLPEQNMTPEEEIERQDDIYLTMMKSWSAFKLRDAQLFVAHHGGEVPQVMADLEDANKKSYQNVSSWGGDRDGNRKRSAKTIASFEPKLQIAIFTLYKEETQPLLKAVPELQGKYDYFDRCITAINNGIYFDEASAKEAETYFLKMLDELIIKHAFHTETYNRLVSLRDLVDIVGYKGHLRCSSSNLI